MEIQELNNKIKVELVKNTGYIKRGAEGYLKHDYLIPGGFYSQQWDWDAFFMGMALSDWISTEAHYLKNLSLNILEQAKIDGTCPGCLTPNGPSTTLMQTKPFTAQGIYIASKKLDDFKWVEEWLDKLENIIMYRERHFWHEEYNLGSWYDAMESGADNNVAMLDYENNTILAPDLNTFLAMEYKAYALISKELGYIEKHDVFLEKSETICNQINKILWCEEDSCYYTFDTVNKEFIKCVSYSSLIPLWAGIAGYEKGKSLIEKHVLNPEELLSDYGIRTLAKNDKAYNNENIIIPYSNWQGPVWPIANYLHTISLALYGYKEEAIEIATKVITICLNDIDNSGGMHENYDAETGKPLAADMFVSWNMLLINVLDQLQEGYHPLHELVCCIVYNKTVTKCSQKV